MGRPIRQVELVFDLGNDNGSVVSCPAKVNTHKIRIKSSPSKRPRKTKRQPLLGEDDEENRSDENGKVLSPRSYKRVVMLAAIVHVVIVAAHFLLNGDNDESPLLGMLIRSARADADAYHNGDNSQSYGLDPVDGDDGVQEDHDAASEETTEMFLSLKRANVDEYQVLLSSSENATIPPDVAPA